MRRAQPISVRVRAPSRGLVTRWPSESADMFRPGDMQRTATAAQNVRYEDGVVCNAPGFTSAELLSSVATGAIAHFRMDDATLPGTRIDAIGGLDLEPLTPLAPDTTLTQVSGKIGKAAHWDAVVDEQALFGGSYTTLKDASFTIAWWQKEDAGGDGHSLFSGNGFRVLRQGGFNQFQVRDNTNTTYSVNTPSFSNGAWHFFVAVYNKGTNQINIYTDGVAATPVSIAAPLHNFFSSNFNVGSGVYVSGVAIDSMTIWTRALSGGEITYLYNGGAGLDYPFLSGSFSLLFQGKLISGTPTPLIGASGGRIYNLAQSFDGVTGKFEITPTSLFSGSSPNVGYPWFAQNFYDRILLAQHDNVAQYFKPGDSSTHNIPGLPSNDDKWDGVEVFFGHVLLWKDDRLKWSDQDDFADWIPVATTAASAILTVSVATYTQPSVGSTVVIPVNENPVSLGLVVGQYVRVTFDVGGVTTENYYLLTAVTGSSITGRLQDFTGIAAPGTVFVSGTQVFTVDANEAGETRVVGSAINGQIFRAIAMGDYCYLFKERCILSMQYVGAGSGVFFIHPEVSEEGPLSRSSVLNLGDGRIIFLGHKELYQYQGGPSPQPVCQQYTRELIRELDRTKLDKIVMYHKETRHEVWVHYPVVGGFKVLIWNYVEDTASIDIYDPELLGLSALCDADWTTDPPWISLPPDQYWVNTVSTTSWSDLGGSFRDRITLIASGSGEVLVWGTAFNRDGAGYTALSETDDFDFGEPDIYKYVDVVALGLQVRNPTNQTRRLGIQVGQRVSLDQDITWTPIKYISVAGNAPNPPVRVNPGGAGKYLRLRVVSTDPDVEWRISSFEIHARPGGFF